MAEGTDPNGRQERAPGAQQTLDDLHQRQGRLDQQVPREPAADRSRGRGLPGQNRSADSRANARVQKRDVSGSRETASTSHRLVRQYRQARQVLRNDDRLAREMQRLGDRLGSTFADIYREPEEAKRAWAKKVHEVGVDGAIKILKEEPETLGRVTRSKEELRRIFEDQEQIPKVLREAEDYGRLAEQRLRPEERARLERQMTQASEQLRTRHEERDLRRDLQKHGLQVGDLNARQRSAARRISQDVHTLAYGGRLWHALEEGRTAADPRGLAKKDPTGLAREVRRARQALEQQAWRYFEKPGQALSHIDASFERRGAARTIRDLGLRPERFGALTGQAQRTLQRQEERRIAGMSRSGHLQGGSRLADRAARYEVARARQAIGREPGKAVYYQQSARSVRQGYDLIYQSGAGAERAFWRAAGRDAGSARYQRALNKLAQNPERYGKLRERTQEARFSTQHVAPKLAAAQRDLDRLRAGELRKIDRAMQALRACAETRSYFQVVGPMSLFVPR